MPARPLSVPAAAGTARRRPRGGREARTAPLAATDLRARGLGRPASGGARGAGERARADGGGDGEGPKAPRPGNRAGLSRGARGPPPHKKCRRAKKLTPARLPVRFAPSASSRERDSAAPTMHRARPGSLKRRLNKKASPGDGAEGGRAPGRAWAPWGLGLTRRAPAGNQGRRAPLCAASEGPLRAGSLPLRGGGPRPERLGGCVRPGKGGGGDVQARARQ
uniref:Uncharacterized protein n=1 Tax=Rangifer tarandus platyrhynchus TaxID=3082113 RepID=A0ACB0FMJ8_RANTA|nr:unnamed protein product [Rangifer tarandus platyrhynchus]